MLTVLARFEKGDLVPSTVAFMIDPLVESLNMSVYNDYNEGLQVGALLDLSLLHDKHLVFAYAKCVGLDVCVSVPTRNNCHVTLDTRPPPYFLCKSKKDRGAWE